MLDIVITIIVNMCSVVAVIAMVWRLIKKLENKLELIDDNNIRTRRIEIGQRVNADKGVGHDKETILRLYDEYKATGGNSYTDDLIKHYLESLE
jgi:hypothetical protein